MATTPRAYHSDAASQLQLWKDNSLGEDPRYLTTQLITYIGNKRSLIHVIGKALDQVRSRLNKNKLRAFDAFSGSGVVSRFLKAHSSSLFANDIEDFATAISKCYLTNRHTIDLSELYDILEFMNHNAETVDLQTGFIEELYAPADETNITRNDRVFYTKSNARRIDNYRRLIDRFPTRYRYLLLGPLLCKASVHANTAGVFKGFYRDRKTRVGRFGGTGSDALRRILGTIVIEPPVLSNYDCDYFVFQDNANSIAKQISNLDVTYVDPPYNQHPYGSNYFMLNLIVNYQRPREISQVSGIPADWKRSHYNVRTRALPALRDLLDSLESKFLIVSFNNEGFISRSEMLSLLQSLGDVQLYETRYNAFRGSRNFNNRSIHVIEQLFLVERR